MPRQQNCTTICAPGRVCAFVLMVLLVIQPASERYCVSNRAAISVLPAKFILAPAIGLRIAQFKFSVFCPNRYSCGFDGQAERLFFWTSLSELRKSAHQLMAI